MGQSLAGVEVKLVSSVEEAHEFIRWLGERRDVLACDTETTGLSPYEDGAALRLVQLGDAMTGWAIPFERWGGVVLEALKKYDGPLIFHNIAFEARWLKAHAQYELPWHRSHDTMIAAHLVDPTATVALKALSARYIDRRAVAGQNLLSEAMAANKWTWATVPIEYEGYWAYACLDTILTARLFTTLNAHNTYNRAYELEMATRRVASQMEDSGSPIDLEYCQRKYDELNSYAESVAAWGQRELGVKLGSGPQLVKWFEEQGATITEFTAKGAPSVNKYQLRMFANSDDPKISAIAKVVLDMRRAGKLATTYFANFMDWHENGVLHPEIRTLRARTGRMSITKPALQTLPKGSATVRDAFIAREGEVLLSCDYSQIEARLMAHFAHDENMILTFKEADATGTDFFTALGRDIYNAPHMDKSDKRRALVKGTMYGKLYGAGIQKMAETAGVGFDQMKSVVDAFDTKYPLVTEFQRQVEHVGGLREKEEGQPYIITPVGRRLPADNGKTYSLVNYLLQSTAADVLKRTMVSLDNAGYGSTMLMPVHDEIIFSVPESDVAQARHDIEEIMSVMTDFLVPLPAEPEGPLRRWGDRYHSADQPYSDPDAEFYPDAA